MNKEDLQHILDSSIEVRVDVIVAIIILSILAAVHWPVIINICLGG